MHPGDAHPFTDSPGNDLPPASARCQSKSRSRVEIAHAYAYMETFLETSGMSVHDLTEAEVCGLYEDIQKQFAAAEWLEAAGYTLVKKH